MMQLRNSYGMATFVGTFVGTNKRDMYIGDDSECR